MNLFCLVRGLRLVYELSNVYFQVRNLKFPAIFFQRIFKSADLQKLMNIKDFFEEMDGGGFPDCEYVFLFEYY